jgi:hypothetical protein
LKEKGLEDEVELKKIREELEISMKKTNSKKTNNIE